MKTTKKAIVKTTEKITKFVPPTTVYIGNLKYDRDERDLRELFSEFGDVKSVMIVQDTETKKSKGIAFIKMFNEKEAKQAISALNGAQFDGRILKVSIANDRFAVPTLAKEKIVVKENSKKISKTKTTMPPKKQGLEVLFSYLNSER